MNESTIKFVDEPQACECVCPSCKIKEESVGSFVSFLRDIVREEGELSFSLLEELLEEFYDDAKLDGKRAAYADIAGYADFKFNETFEDEELENE